MKPKEKVLLKFEKEVSDFIDGSYTTIVKDDVTYLNNPNWYVKVGDNMYEHLTYEELPKQIKELLAKESKQ